MTTPALLIKLLKPLPLSTDASIMRRKVSAVLTAHSAPIKRRRALQGRRSRGWPSPEGIADGPVKRRSPPPLPGQKGTAGNIHILIDGAVDVQKVELALRVGESHAHKGTARMDFLQDAAQLSGSLISAFPMQMATPSSVW